MRRSPKLWNPLAAVAFLFIWRILPELVNLTILPQLLTPEIVLEAIEQL
jgi:hypothetical protein